MMTRGTQQATMPRGRWLRHDAASRWAGAMLLLFTLLLSPALSHLPPSTTLAQAESFATPEGDDLDEVIETILPADDPDDAALTESDPPTQLEPADGPDDVDDAEEPDSSRDEIAPGTPAAAPMLRQTNELAAEVSLTVTNGSSVEFGQVKIGAGPEIREHAITFSVSAAGPVTVCLTAVKKPDLADQSALGVEALAWRVSGSGDGDFADFTSDQPGECIEVVTEETSLDLQLTVPLAADPGSYSVVVTFTIDLNAGF